MQAETLYHTLHQKPFRPFRVHLSDGRTYDVPYPQRAMVGRTFLVIGIPIPGIDDPYVCDHTIHLDITSVDRVEILGASSAVSN